MSQIIVEKISNTAQIPMRVNEFASGMDLRSDIKISIPPWSREVVTTGINIKLPDQCYGHIAPRSGLAVTHGIMVGAGVIDADYTG